MRELPESGLIVSCYLESMKGCEKNLIDAVCRMDEVVALRVEGLRNIAFARQLCPDKYIIGLVKVEYAHKGKEKKLCITPDIIYADLIMDAGADMVATGCYNEWLDLPATCPVMLDIRDFKNMIWPSRLGHIPDPLVIATTYQQKAFDLVKELKEKYPEAYINLEGGIETAEEVRRGFECGARWVTIGKAINDPPTIIENLLKGRCNGSHL